MNALGPGDAFQSAAETGGKGAILRNNTLQSRCAGVRALYENFEHYKHLPTTLSLLR